MNANYMVYMMKKQKGRVIVRAWYQSLATTTTTNKHCRCHKQHKRLNRLPVKNSSFTNHYSFLHVKTRLQSWLLSQTAQMHNNNIHIAAKHSKKANKEIISGICALHLHLATNTNYTNT